jgi:hypothetical protein
MMAEDGESLGPMVQAVIQEFLEAERVVVCYEAHGASRRSGEGKAS